MQSPVKTTPPWAPLFYTLAGFLCALAPQAASAQNSDDEVPTVELSAAFLSAGTPPVFFVLGPDGEFIPFQIGANRFGPSKELVLQNGGIALYQEQDDPETEQKRMVPVIREALPAETRSVMLVFYFNAQNKIQRRIFTEPEEGPQPLTMRLINLMDSRVAVYVKNERMGEAELMLKPGEDRNVQLNFTPDESFWYRFVRERPGEDPWDSRWKSMSLLDGQRMIVFYTNLRMVSQEFDEETGAVTNQEISFRPTDLRIMQLGVGDNASTR